jgi:sugar O-acyltransferase (sialic acid O-acetyltransferase NeuD family)
MKPVLIVGAGGHAKVLADALLASGRQVLGFVESSAKDGHQAEVLPGLLVLGTDEVLLSYAPAEVELVNGLGGIDCGGLRRRVQAKLEADGWYFSGVCHPAAQVSPFAFVSAGVQLLACCIVQAGARLGVGSIINTAAVVEHDSTLEEYVHVAPRAVLCGNTYVGCNSHIGAGAIVRQGLILGANTLVGAGAVVVKDFDGQGTLIGVPARQGDLQ